MLESSGRDRRVPAGQAVRGRGGERVREDPQEKGQQLQHKRGPGQRQRQQKQVGDLKIKY